MKISTLSQQFTKKQLRFMVFKIKDKYLTLVNVDLYSETKHIAL